MHMLRLGIHLTTCDRSLGSMCCLSVVGVLVGGALREPIPLLAGQPASSTVASLQADVGFDRCGRTRLPQVHLDTTTRQHQAPVDTSTKL
jgi:hypothetical protein